MNRLERRRLERETLKNNRKYTENEIWFDKLSIDRKAFIGKFIEQRAAENDNLVAAIMNMCVASSIDDILDIDVVDIKKIINDGDGYIADYKEYLEKQGYEEGFNMIENEKIKEEVKEKIKGYMTNGIDKAKSLRLLRKEFNLPNAELSNLWIECKESNDIKHKKATKNGDHENIVNIHETKDTETISFNDPLESIIKYDIDIPDEFKESGQKVKNKCSGLVEVSVVREIRGQHGLYRKDIEGVHIDGNDYRDVSEVALKIGESKKEYENRKDDLMKRIEEMNNELKAMDEIWNNEMDKYDELIQVFDF